MNKALKMVGIAIGAVCAAKATGKLLHSQREKLIKAHEEEANIALKSFVLANWLAHDELQYASDSGYTPIYVFDANMVNFDDMKAPKGYVLQKNILPENGGVTYQLGKRINSDKMISSYFQVLANFCSKEDWEAAN